MTCPCGSKLDERACCGALLSGEREASTALELMRSRYAAHVRGDVDYIVRTTVPEQQANLNRAEILAWCTDSVWLGLEILKAEDGESGDQTGVVEFRADFELRGVRQSHRERSRFERRGQLWFFDGEASVHPTEPVQNAGRVGRNDPCPCGSGKKRKKCCGR